MLKLRSHHFTSAVFIQTSKIILAAESSDMHRETLLFV